MPDASRGGPAVVFDLGGVLIDWDPRYLYRRLFGADEAGMERFLAEVCTLEWNGRQDAGRSWQEAVDELVRRHPDQAEHIRAYDERWEETIGGELPETVDVLAELRAAGTRLYALTNWSAEKFPYARRTFPFLAWFEGIVVSGEEGMAKPHPRIFALCCERFGLDPAVTVYVDDSPRNVAAASAHGLRALRFTDAAALRADLVAAGLLPRAPGGSSSRT